VESERMIVLLSWEKELTDNYSDSNGWATMENKDQIDNTMRVWSEERV